MWAVADRLRFISLFDGYFTVHVPILIYIVYVTNFIVRGSGMSDLTPKLIRLAQNGTNTLYGTFSHHISVAYI